MRRIAPSLLAVLCLLVSPAAVAAPDCQEAVSLTSGDTNVVVAVEPHSDGGWVTAFAHTWVTDHFYMSANLDRYDASGALLWSWQEGAFSPAKEPSAAAVLTSGAVLVGGANGSYGSLTEGSFLKLVGPDGVTLSSWQGGPSYSPARYPALAAAPDGGAFAMWRVWSDRELQRWSAGGDLLWSYEGAAGASGTWKNVGTVGLEAFEGGAVFAGTYSGGHAFLAHVAGDATPLWELDLSTTGLDVVTDMAVGDASIFVLGEDAGGPVVARVAANGTVAGLHPVPGGILEAAHSVGAHPDGGWSVAGVAASPDGPSTDGGLVRVDDTGAPLWVETFGSWPYDESFTHHAVTSDGNLVAAGPNASAAKVAFWTVLATDTCGGAAPECLSDAECADDDLCNGAEQCHFGVCTPGEAVDCSGLADQCHTAACDAATGGCDAHPLPASTACDDGDVCTWGDTCGADGSCSGPPADCDDGDPCTADVCHATWGCQSTPDTSLPTCPESCAEWGHATDLKTSWAGFDDVAVLPGGDVAAMAYTFDQAPNEFAVVRGYDRVGAELYTAKWGGNLYYTNTDGEVPIAIAPLSDGTYVLASDKGYPDKPTVRVVDSAGAVQWSLTEPSNLGTTIEDVADAGDGAVVLAGSYLGQARVRKLQSGGAGAWDWISKLGYGSAGISASAIAARPDGSHVVVGRGTGGDDAWMVLLDEEGQQILFTEIDATQPLVEVVDVVAVGSRVVVLGIPAGEPGRVALVAFSATGKPLWRRVYGGADVELIPGSLHPGPGKRVSIVGSHRLEGGDADGWYLLAGHRGTPLIEDVVGEPGVDDWLTGHARAESGAVVAVGRRPHPSNIWQATAWIVQRCDW